MLRLYVHSLEQLLVVHTIGNWHRKDILADLLYDRTFVQRTLSPLLSALHLPLTAGAGHLGVVHIARLRRVLNGLLVQRVVGVVVFVKDEWLVKVLSLVLGSVIVVLGIHHMEVVLIVAIPVFCKVLVQRVRIDWLPPIPVVPAI